MREGKLKVIFFDVMGTVISLKAWVVAMMNEFTRISKEHNVAFEDVSGAWDVEWRNVNQEVRRDKTKPFRSIRELFNEAFIRVGDRIGVELTEKNVADSLERVYEYVNEHAEAFPDVPKTLETLKKEGYTVGIISDADSGDLILQLKSAGIFKHFDTLTTSSEVMCYKPDAKIFETALAKANCESNQACHVGDTPEHDVMGANQIGLPSILITHGRVKTNAKSPKATFVIKEVSEVLPLLHRLS